MEFEHSIIYIIFLIFTGTAVLSTVALYTRQSLLVAYIALGAILGPWGLKLINDAKLIQQTGDIGILFLLFLLGLHLHPQDLFHSLRKMSWIALVSSWIFFVIGFIVGYLFHYTLVECIIIGATMMFSSTIIGLKLLPTTILHHQHTGELMISILLLQDIIAIAVLLFLKVFEDHIISWQECVSVIIGFPALLLVAYLFERYLLAKLLLKFDKVHEYIFILSIGWCLCMTELSIFIGLPGEIGAFIAGVALATHPISLYIAESLKPLRDFFLVMFFFSIGATFNIGAISSIIIPATILAVLMLLLKPVVFCFLLRKFGETRATGWEIGVRLGQISEFSLLVIFLALQTNMVSVTSMNMILTATIFTFVISCYWVTFCYPTPLATTDQLRRD
jgi:Kef-type K+ transport system membrane component KefB